MFLLPNFLNAAFCKLRYNKHTVQRMQQSNKKADFQKQELIQDS